jgi:flagellar hook-associated protein 3 FlgL
MLDRPLPDLAASLALRRQGQSLRLQLDRAGEELATGLKSDLFAASGGDPARLMAIERGQATAAAEIEGLALAEARIAAVQASLGRIEEAAGAIGAPLLAAVRRDDPVATRALAVEARSAFADVVARLNTQSGGRALFAGAAVDGDALAPAETMLTDLAAVAAGATDADDLVARIDAWFDDAGGAFETTAWLGEGAAPRVRLGEGTEAALSVRADAPEFRSVMKALALAAVVSDAAYAGPPDAVRPALETAAVRAIAAVDSVVALRADIGISEARIEEAAAAASARRAALDTAWNDAVARDPYEAASAFQALETQLQTAYTVTARIARLTLADMLR